MHADMSHAILLHHKAKPLLQIASFNSNKVSKMSAYVTVKSKLDFNSTFVRSR